MSNHSINVQGQELATDPEGYLKNLDDWNSAVASAIAQQEQITLSEDHWEIIELLRDFYQEFEIAPAMRVLVKQTANKLGPEKGKSIYLMQLLTPSPAKLASKIAGLPRPTNCL